MTWISPLHQNKGDGKRLYNFTRGKQKFDHGHLPCYYCSVGHHDRCHVRLDGSLCTCSCPEAEDTRLDIEALSIAYKTKNLPIPPIEELVKQLNPSKIRKTRNT